MTEQKKLTENTDKAQGRGRPVNASSILSVAPTKDGRIALKHQDHSKVAELPELEAILNAEVTIWKRLENEAAFRAMRIGILILKAREDLGHGEFLPWCSKVLPLGKTTIWRFTKIAEKFLTQKQVSLDVAVAEIAPRLVGGKVVPPSEDNETVQLAFDFVGGKSFIEMCDELGLPVNRIGGDTSDKRHYLNGEERAALEKANAEQLLMQAVTALGELVAKRRFVHVDPPLLSTSIKELRRRVQDLEKLSEKGK